MSPLAIVIVCMLCVVLGFMLAMIAIIFAERFSNEFARNADVRLEDITLKSLDPTPTWTMIEDFPATVREDHAGTQPADPEVEQVNLPVDRNNPPVQRRYTPRPGSEQKFCWCHQRAFQPGEMLWWWPMPDTDEVKGEVRLICQEAADAQ